MNLNQPMEMEIEKQSDSKINYYHNQQRKFERIPKILAVLSLSVACVQIIISVTLLVRCKSSLDYIKDTVRLTEAPCYHIVTPSYLGCLIILATIFSLCCLGKRIIAILFFLLSFLGAIWGIYLLICKTCSTTNSEIFDYLNATVIECDKDEEINVNCWRELSSNHVICVKTADWIINKCVNHTSVLKFKTSEIKMATSIKNCSEDLYATITDTQKFYMQFIFPLIFLTTVFSFVVSSLLIYAENAIVNLNRSIENDSEVLTELQTTENIAIETKSNSCWKIWTVQFRKCFPKISKLRHKNHQQTHV